MDSLVFATALISSEPFNLLIQEYFLAPFIIRNPFNLLRFSSPC